MNVQPIRNPLPGEQILEVYPALQPDGVGGWGRRLNLYRGRSLSDTALNTEQLHRASRLAMLGQMVSAGITTGLEVGLESASDPADVMLQMTAGRGITVSGEDVVLPTAQRLTVHDLPVYAPVSLLDDVDDPDELATEILMPRRLGDSLGSLIADGKAVDLPRVGILVLQPIEAAVVGEFDPTDPCEQDPENYAFEDWQIIDGCRPVLYAWPLEWRSLPTPSPQWRNQIAYTIFAAEQALTSGEILPWEAVGVPLGLIGFDESWMPLFVDGYAVVREGGKANSRTPLLADQGTPFLWQARVQQFAEQLAEVDLAATPLDQVAQQFLTLPPVGLLPKSAVDAGRILFFPNTYSVRATPMPLEQLDLVMRASASLAPFDLTVPDQVEVVVPVPQIWYEPNLLQEAAVDAEFQDTIDEFSDRRAEWLQRRQTVREKAQALYTALKGEPLEYPDPDPNALEPDEAVATGELDPPEAEYGTTDAESGEGKQVTALEDLKASFAESSLASDFETLDEVGLERFIQSLEDKVKKSNDKLDLGFLRSQTDIYRIRQLVLGSEAASRLATSPTLANIAKQDESALVTQQNINAYFNRLNEQLSSNATVTSAGTAAGPRLSVSTTAAPSTISRSFISPELNLGESQFTNISASPGRFVERPPLNLEQAVIFQPGLQQLELGQQQTVTGSKAFFGSRFSEIPVDIVLEQSPIVGETSRTVTVGERLKTPPSTEAKTFAVEGRYQAVAGLASLEINISDLQVPGLTDAETNRTFGEIQDPQTGGAILDRLLRGTYDPVEAEDESAYFAAGVRAIDNTIATLRLIEGRVQEYRLAIATCRKTLSTLQTLLLQTDSRLKVIGDELAEARHDVAVARNLLAEEQMRIDGINERRQRILAEQVPFIAFHRPRSVSARLEVPVRPLDPGLVEATIPTCLQTHGEIPAELRETVDLLRDAPVKWFTAIAPLLQRLDRLDVLLNVLQTAKVRANLPTLTAATAITAGQGLLGQSLNQVFLAQRQVVQNYRLQTAQLNLGALNGLTWQQTRDRAQDTLALGDLIDGNHGRSDVVQQAARELENITRMAGCLYAAFGAVLPAIRLDWAERLSQFDESVNLRQLNSLPRWGEIEFLDRQALQTLVDWLYQRVNQNQTEAIALINDLVRVCILLASHAPVHQIIAGRVAKPAVVKPNQRVELAIDPGKVHIGMKVAWYGAGNTVVAQGIVEDLAAGQASARITQAFQLNTQLTETTRAQFTS